MPYFNREIIDFHGLLPKYRTTNRGRILAAHEGWLEPFRSSFLLLRVAIITLIVGAAIMLLLSVKILH